MITQYKITQKTKQEVDLFLWWDKFASIKRVQDKKCFLKRGF